MKEISISTPNHNKLKSSSNKWVFIILSITFSQIFLLGFIYYKQKGKLNLLLDEIQTLESFIESQQPILDTKSELKKDYESLLNKKTYLTGNTQLPKVILKKISKSIPSECCISNFTIKKNIITIKGITKTWNALNKFFDTLSTINKLGEIRLKSSMKDSQFLNFEIEFLKHKNMKN